MTKPIESTGHIQTIEQREAAALEAMKNMLATISSRLMVLHECEAARFCIRAIKAIKEK